jgi:hypothetical protein
MWLPKLTSYGSAPQLVPSEVPTRGCVYSAVQWDVYARIKHDQAVSISSDDIVGILVDSIRPVVSNM